MKTHYKKAEKKWDLLISGSEREFFACFINCYDDLYRLGFFLYRDKELSKECIQLLFIELWKVRKKTLEIYNTKEYVIKIFKRILYKQNKMRIVYSSRITLMQNNNEFEEINEMEDVYPKETIAEQDEEQKRLIVIMDQLSARQKELIELRYLKEKSIDEIAAITSLTHRTIYNTLHNALTKLREAVV